MEVNTIGFEEECKSVVGNLRAAIIELYDSIGADPLSPQDVSRRFALNKTLTWNIARMIQAPGGVEAIPHVPGIASIEKVIRAASTHGATEQCAENVRRAAQAFDKMVEVHVGDRATLELITDSLASDAADRLEHSRKLAFRGNSGLYGVQAKTRVTTHFVAPNSEDPSRLDLACVHGYVGFRRLRASVTWPLFKAQRWDRSTDSPITDDWQPLQGMATSLPDPKLIENFTCGRLPEMHVVENTHGADIMLSPGSIGNHGAFDCFRGEQRESVVDRYQTDADGIGEFGATVTTPCENLILDVIYHEDLGWIEQADMHLFGSITSHGVSTLDDSESLPLPIKKPPVVIPGTPPSVATPLISRYPELVVSVLGALGFESRAFRGIRLELQYPPLGSHVVLRADLPSAGD